MAFVLKLPAEEKSLYSHLLYEIEKQNLKP